MAITLPSVDDLRTFWGDESDAIDDDRAELLISLSSDLFWLATGLDNDQQDSRLSELVKYAILDMSIFLFSTREDLDASYSPFQSERIGSYSYSKSYSRLSRTIAHNEPTGATLFDKVVADLLDELAYGDGTVVGGIKISRDYYVPLRYEAYNRNPYGFFGPGLGSADADTGLYY